MPRLTAMEALYLGDTLAVLPCNAQHQEINDLLLSSDKIGASDLDPQGSMYAWQSLGC